MPKYLLFIALLIWGLHQNIRAQQPLKPKKGWQNLDLQKDSVFGISTQKAYDELLKGKDHKPVIVAIIDGGVDVSHQDLHNNVWLNQKEIPGNGIDDDHNGYIDDLYGWNFIGSDKGNVTYDNLEITRLSKVYIDKYQNGDTSSLKGKQLVEFIKFKDLRKKYNEEVSKCKRIFRMFYGIDTTYKLMAARLNNPNAGLQEIKKFKTTNEREWAIKKMLKIILTDTDKVSDIETKAIEPGLKLISEKLQYHYNIDYDPRSIVGDNYDNKSEKLYGNNDVRGPNSDHGTHVAGIIAAQRDNNIDVKGVAKDIKIMSVRIVPNGDERDKDVANAIRYATDNGAKIINMSFGKLYSPDKKFVDDAVKYAMKNDVLIIHAAGNDVLDTDKEPVFPNKKYEDNSGEASAWIEVGASGPNNTERLVAPFSNHGKQTVDVFAPGVNIYSTIKGNKYEYMSGTSMAAPVVSGLAALIWSYYPKLTAVNVKEIILKSVIKVPGNLFYLEKGKKRKGTLDTLCNSGGIVNAYNALSLAATN